MTTFLIITILIVAAFIVYQSYKGNQDIKNVERYGGIEYKYSVLIKNILSTDRGLKLFKRNKNNLEIENDSITRSGIKYRLIEMSGYIQVTYTKKDYLTDNTQRLVFKYHESENQDEMFNKLIDSIFQYDLPKK